MQDKEFTWKPTVGCHTESVCSPKENHLSQLYLCTSSLKFKSLDENTPLDVRRDSFARQGRKQNEIKRLCTNKDAEH